MIALKGFQAGWSRIPGSVDALHFHNEHGEVCPAGWTKGDDGMKPSAEGVASYLKSKASSL